MDADIKELVVIMYREQANASKAIADLAATVDRYVTASEERVKRLEANLDGLIRIIASEHGNGKKKL
jgi:hypothetical protein